MSEPLRTPEDYELFLYTLPQQSDYIQSSSVVFIRLGAALGKVTGELEFDHGFRIVVRERLLLDRSPVLIDWYGYEVWRGDEKLFWYDPQPHPNDLKLQATYPHHKHVRPDPKHNRVPAPAMSFISANLPMLIREVEALVTAAGD